MSTVKRINIILLCSLVIAVSVSVVSFAEDCDAVRDSTFRLHIVANSDSEEDQSVKLKVRDEILLLAEKLYDGCENEEDAKKITAQNLQAFCDAANKVLKENGFSYTAVAMLGTVDFDTREYEDFTLPAGKYEALKIILGEGKGHNWWCILYPKVCVSLCSGGFKDELNERQNKMITSKKKYKIAFRSVEIYEEIKKFAKKYL